MKKIQISATGSVTTSDLDQIEMHLVAEATRTNSPLFILEPLCRRLGIELEINNNLPTRPVGRFNKSQYDGDFCWTDAREEMVYPMTELGIKELTFTRVAIQIEDSNQSTSKKEEVKSHDGFAYRFEGTDIQDMAFVQAFIPGDYYGDCPRYCRQHIEAACEIARRLGYNPRITWEWEPESIWLSREQRAAVGF